MPSESSGRRVIRFGTFELDVRAGELRNGGAKVRLQEQPFRILEMLLANPRELVTRDELRSRLWPSHTMPYVKVGPWFDPVRSDTRFDDLLRRMRFPGI